MFTSNVVPKPSFPGTLLAAAAITLASAACTGCSATQTPMQYPAEDSSIRAGFASFRSAHTDPDAIGSLDTAAVSINLDRNGRPLEPVSYTPASVSRHPLR